MTSWSRARILYAVVLTCGVVALQRTLALQTLHLASGQPDRWWDLAILILLTLLLSRPYLQPLRRRQLALTRSEGDRGWVGAGLFAWALAALVGITSLMCSFGVAVTMLPKDSGSAVVEARILSNRWIRREGSAPHNRLETTSWRGLEREVFITRTRLFTDWQPGGTVTVRLRQSLLGWWIIESMRLNPPGGAQTSGNG
jgi:hypothetical protein